MIEDRVSKFELRGTVNLHLHGTVSANKQKSYLRLDLPNVAPALFRYSELQSDLCIRFINLTNGTCHDFVTNLKFLIAQKVSRFFVTVLFVILSCIFLRRYIYQFFLWYISNSCIMKLYQGNST